MKTQIKVKDTRMHKIKHQYPDSVHDFEIPVAEGKLVLVECKPEEALIVLSQYGYGFIINKCNESGTWVDIKGKNWTISCPIDTLTYLKPILISETEKIEAGDEFYHLKHKRIISYKGENDPWKDSTLKDKVWRKILALPEHFSPKHLQAIVDGKLKDGDKVLVECGKYKRRSNPVERDMIADVIGYAQEELLNDLESEVITFIKFNSSNHITLHRLEERTYTREEVLEILEEYRKAVLDEVSANLYTPSINKWFEQNVK